MVSRPTKATFLREQSKIPQSTHCIHTGHGCFPPVGRSWCVGPAMAQEDLFPFMLLILVACPGCGPTGLGLIMITNRSFRWYQPRRVHWARAKLSQTCQTGDIEPLFAAGAGHHEAVPRYMGLSAANTDDATQFVLKKKPPVAIFRSLGNQPSYSTAKDCAKRWSRMLKKARAFGRTHVPVRRSRHNKYQG